VTEPDVKQLLAPLTEPDGASRRVHVDREKIIAGMVEASLAPDERFSSRARWATVLALAAGLALAAWGGMHWLRGSEQAALPDMKVAVVRGQVTPLGADGALETSANSEAHVSTGGLDLQLLENTKVSLKELRASATSSSVRLDRGSVRCVVRHDPSRQFSVVTADARVVDIGTIFTVSVQPSPTGPKTLVQVEEGEVVVHHAGGQSRVTAAQSWPSLAPEPPAVVEAPVRANHPGPTEEVRPKHIPARRTRETLETETQLLRSALASEQKGDLPAARKTLESLVARYPESPLAPDARAALSRVKRRLESSK
jgi:hypothetical protein